MTLPATSRAATPRAWAAAAIVVAVAVLAFVATTLVLDARQPAPETPGTQPSSRPMVVTEAGGAPTVTEGQLRALGGVRQSGNTIGSSRAPVVLVEFEDPQCVACRQYDLSVSDQVVAGLVEPGTVQVRRYPLTFIGPDSVPAARWAYAAGRQDRMWQFMRAFHLNAGAENSGYVTDGHLRQVAALVPGLDVARAGRDASSPAAQTFLDSSRTLARRLGVTGTPAVLVGPDVDHLQPVTLRDTSDYDTLRSAVAAVRRDGRVPSSASSPDATPGSTPASTPVPSPSACSATASICQAG